MSDRNRRLLWLAIFIGCALPAADLVRRLFFGDLGADPVETLIRTTGDWAIKLVVAGLLLTPLSRILRNPLPIRFRRMIGLYAFFYVCVHLTLYLVIDQGLDLSSIVKDILKRPYITFGMAAFLTLVPLAITSTNKMVSRLGPRRWRQLHRAVYAAAVFGVVHYYLLVKLDITWPLFYGAILAVALGWRVMRAWPVRLIVAEKKTARPGRIAPSLPKSDSLRTGS